jgi:hypothetical protein
MKRSSGVLLPFHSKSLPHTLLQHFHPVCRAARSFPHLPAARLLLSLTDCDLPLLPTEKGFMVSAFSSSENNRDNPFYNGLYLWRRIDKYSPLLSDLADVIGYNLMTTGLFLLALLAFYFKSFMSLVFYSLLSMPEWVQFLFFEVVSLGALNFFCVALYASQRYIPSPGGAILTAVATLAAATGFCGYIYKLLVYDRQQQSLNEKARQEQKRRKQQEGIEKEIYRIRDLRSQLWVQRKS